YREMGFLPSALRNYLARLGWSHGDDEVMTTEQMIEWFDIIDINRSASRFDMKKLEALNGVHMRAATAEDLTAALLDTAPYLPNGAFLTNLGERGQELLAAAMPGLKERAKTLVELAD